MSVVLADGGIETALDERLGQVLPEFAAFTLLDSAEGRTALAEYYRPFLELATATGHDLVLDTPTWRANPDWVRALGFAETDTARVNEAAVRLVKAVAGDFAPDANVVVNGCVGPRYDDYVSAERMTAAEAEHYHTVQVAALAAAGVDRVTSVTTLDVPEAIGVTRAAEAHGLPVAVSFTVTADGVLPDGHSLAAAIQATDAATDGAPIGYLVNCAHPDEARAALSRSAETASGRAALERVIGLRLNAAHHDDNGRGDDPERFAEGVLALRTLAPSAVVFGGCCGTDTPHIAAIAAALGADVQ